jgi:hypothetical protein
LLEGALDKQNIFFRKIVEETADLEEVLNKALITVSKANKASYFFEVFRDGPIDNSFNLD